MTTYLDEPFAKVWVDENIPCVFSAIRQSLSNGQINTLAETKLTCLKSLHRKFGEVYSVTDLKSCAGMSEGTAFIYMIKIVRPEFTSGLSYKLFIRPEEKKARASLRNSLFLLPVLKADVFRSFEEALKAINNLKLTRMETDESPKGMFGFIYTLIS